MTKHNKRCWSCGGTGLTDKGEYVQCDGCGATWNDVQEVHSPAMIDDPVDYSGHTSPDGHGIGRPSASVKAAATKARNKARAE